MTSLITQYDCNIYMFILVDKTVSESIGTVSERTELSVTNTTSAADSASVDVAASGSQANSSSNSSASMARLPLPPPPPPPSSVFPTEPTPISYFPSLPPPPVENLPVQMPPHYMYPDVRWRFASTAPHHSAVFHQPFHPPPVLPYAPQPFNLSVQSIPATQQSQSLHSGTVPHLNASNTGEGLPLSLQSIDSSVSEMVSSTSSAKSSNTPVIKDFKVKGATPRFVPRQLSTAQTTCANSDNTRQNRDPVIEELKQNAFVLSSKVQGPSLPAQNERKRKEFKTSDTGSESLDKTVHAIRQKVSQVGANITF